MLAQRAPATADEDGLRCRTIGREHVAVQQQLGFLDARQHDQVRSLSRRDHSGEPPAGARSAVRRARIQDFAARRAVAVRRDDALAQHEPLSVLEPPQLFDRRDRDIAVGADAERTVLREIRREGEQAVTQVRLGRRTQTRNGTAAREAGDLVCVEMRRMHQTPARVDVVVCEQPRNGTSTEHRFDPRDFAQLLGDVKMDGDVRRRAVEQRLQLAGCDGAQRVRAHADDNLGVVRVVGAQDLRDLEHIVDAGRKATLTFVERRAAGVTVCVQRGKQTDRDPRVARRLDERTCHCGTIIVPIAARIAMQVMKLGNRGVACGKHRAVDVTRNREQGVGIERFGECVHRLAPGPEIVFAVRAPFGAPGHRALEGVRVEVRHAGDERAVEPLGAERIDPGLNRDDRAVGCDVDGDVGRNPLGEQRFGREEAHVHLYDTLWLNASLATMEPNGPPFGMIADGALAASDGIIAWVGPRADLPDAPERLARSVIDVGGRLVTPGLVDAHTHLVFGGDRIADFERRVGGESYVTAAAGGSGIAHTVSLTRAASEDALFAAALERLRTMVSHGATTVEIKSGYGLDLETELQLLRVARRLGEATGISVRTTYLGAHVVPPEYAEQRDAYLALICETMLPRIAREQLADAVDVFCDRIAFTPAETERVLDAAHAVGLPVKLHADQIENSGAAALAARYHALSADHLEHTDDDGVAALAASGTVAVLVPGAYYYLRETAKPPVDALRRYGVPIAVATDCNPGTSPILTLTTVTNMACMLFGLTPHEAVAGVTRNAAHALGLTDRGILRPGTRCDLALWDVSSPAELCYWLGANRCSSVVVAGKPLQSPSSPSSC